MSSKLFENFSALKEEVLGSAFWASGYFCATLTRMMKEMTKKVFGRSF
ncbi:protein of unknown function [Georgfuchsia toluolica]|uniref:Uncharacterized protein n=2 Tax=Georgfuchsia toluolica TaxID=424218 RepID=A0A916J5L4_9PROT|nr:protein of unknown function [Georgfuchsia toluolica]